MVSAAATLGMLLLIATLLRLLLIPLMPLALVLAALFRGGTVHIGTLESIQAGLGLAVLLALAILTHRLVRLAERAVDNAGRHFKITEVHTKAIEDLQRTVSELKVHQIGLGLLDTLQEKGYRFSGLLSSGGQSPPVPHD